jgi:WD40 repeat protein
MHNRAMGSRVLWTGCCLLVVIAVTPVSVRGQDGNRTEGATEVASFLTQWDVYAVALDPDSKRIVTGNYSGYDSNGKIFVLDAATGKQLLKIRALVSTIRTVAVSPNGKRVACGSSRGVAVYELDTGKALFEVGARGKRFEDTTVGIAFSPDGKFLVSGGGDIDGHANDRPPGVLELREADTGKVIRELKGHKALVAGVAFSPDGKRVVSGSWDGTVKVWEADTGKEVLTLKGHEGIVTAVAVSADGQRIVSGGGGVFTKPNGNLVDHAAAAGEVKVWDAGTGKEVLDLKGQAKGVAAVAISPDGKRVAAGGRDQTATVWDATSGRTVATLRGFKETVNAVTFSRDGERVITGDGNGFVKVWALRK